MSTRRWFAWQAFRMRVSMSATGSVMLIVSSSPAGLTNAGDLALQGEIAEADPAQAEPPEHRTGAATPLTAAHHPALELRGALGALDPTGLRHILLPDPDGGLAAERPAELAQRSVTAAPIGIPTRRPKLAIAFFARVVTGRWPLISISSSITASRSFGCLCASPIPTLSTILVRRGTSCALARPNSFASAGRTTVS